jgi:hypothetical protein
MNTTLETTKRYNEGLERGRRHQERGGYQIPSGAYSLPSSEIAEYEAGWEKGFATTTRLDLLRK